MFDKHHSIEAGKVFPVCGNTYRMLQQTRFARISALLVISIATTACLKAAAVRSHLIGRLQLQRPQLPLAAAEAAP